MIELAAAERHGPAPIQILERLRSVAPEFATPPIPPETAVVVPPLYYDSGRHEYLLQNTRGAWLSLTEAQTKQHLRALGLRARAYPSEHVSPLETVLIDVRQTQDVQYVGALAGCREGFHDLGHCRILVTSAPRIIEPRAGEWPVLGTVLRNLLVDPCRDQTPLLFGWLKMAYESLRAGTRRPGQALVIAGSRDCGKSFVQKHVITPILGGRYAKPYQFFCGGTSFNSDLFEAEHLIIEDEQAGTDIRTRRGVGAQIKAVTANEGQRCHAKGRQAVSLDPFWRLSITLNDEAENLMVLPPLDESLNDKLILLRAQRHPMPMPTRTHTEREAFLRTITAEIPAFLAHLEAMVVPEELRSERYGIGHWHHPDLLAAIDALAPESRLLSLIDGTIFNSMLLPQTWTGSAEDLEAQLAIAPTSSYEARRLFSFPTACGVYLGRLAAKHPARIQYHRTATRRAWTIHPPPAEPAGGPVGGGMTG